MFTEEQLEFFYNRIVDLITEKSSSIETIIKMYRNTTYKGLCIGEFDEVLSLVSAYNAEYLSNMCRTCSCNQCIIKCFEKYLDLRAQTKLE